MRIEDKIARVTQIAFRLATYDWAFAREEAAGIDAHWNERLRLKPKMFDGRVLLAHSLALDGHTLRGACFETRYRNFLAWSDFGFPGAPIVNCFAMAALRAADGAFMLGEMARATANGGMLYFPAGTPEPGDIDWDGNLALEVNVLRELTEETGLGADEVELDPEWSVVFAGAKVACMRLVRSSQTAAELRARLRAFNRSQPDPELSDLIPVRGPRDFDPKRMPGFVLRYLATVLPGE